MPVKKNETPMDVDAILSNFPAAPAPGKAVISAKPAPAAVAVAEPEEAPAPKRQFGIYARRVDKFNTKRIRVLMTPAVCPKCRLDLIALNNLEPWDDLDNATRQELIAGVAEHVHKVHDATEQDIIDEDQLPKQFLGPKFEKQQLRTKTK